MRGIPQPKSYSGSPFDFESAKFFLDYWKSDANGNTTRDFADSGPMTRTVTNAAYTTEPYKEYKKLTGYLTWYNLVWRGNTRKGNNFTFQIANYRVYPDNLLEIKQVLVFQINLLMILMEGMLLGVINLIGIVREKKIQ